MARVVRRKILIRINKNNDSYRKNQPDEKKDLLKLVNLFNCHPNGKYPSWLV